MEYTLIALFSLVASLIAFYTGFGLSTILVPVVAIFLPLPLAISLTAVVHLVHNLLRSGLLWSKINWPVAARFGIPALVALIPGVWLLQTLSFQEPLFDYSWGQISWLHLLIGFLLIFFGTLELANKQGVPNGNLALGGVLSGFFGGLSGNQGVFRSLFLVGVKLSKEAFISTGAIISTAIDLLRLTLYGFAFGPLIAERAAFLLLAAILGAFAGIGIGLKFLPKISMRSVRKGVIVLIYVFGFLLMAGIV
jgi:uncharacterized protein